MQWIVRACMAALPLIPMHASAQARREISIEVREWKVGGSPRALAIAPDRVWFADSGAIGQLNTLTGATHRWPLGPEVRVPLTSVGSDLLFSGAVNRVSRRDTGFVASRDYIIRDTVLHHLRSLVTDRRTGMVWFVSESAPGVGRLNPSNGAFMRWDLTRDSRPGGLQLDSKGNPWFAKSGRMAVGTVDVVRRASREIVLHDSLARPEDIAITSTDGVWFTDPANTRVGCLDAASEVARFVALPRAGLRPRSIVADGRDVLWLVSGDADGSTSLSAYDTGAGEWASLRGTFSGQTRISTIVYDWIGDAVWIGTADGTVVQLRAKPSRTPSRTDAPRRAC